MVLLEKKQTKWGAYLARKQGFRPWISTKMLCLNLFKQQMPEYHKGNINVLSKYSGPGFGVIKVIVGLSPERN